MNRLWGTGIITIIIRQSPMLDLATPKHKSFYQKNFTLKFF